MNKILSRVYYAIDVELKSPLSLSSGENESTDFDVLRNAAGELFIPGTSIAGAMRSYLQYKKDESCLFGFSKNEDGKMSSVFVSDLYLLNGKLSVRDFVQLSEDKQVENKFDMEIIETGATGTFYMNYIVREKDENNHFKEEVNAVLQAATNGEIRFGARKNRGFGRIEIRNIFIKEFDARNERDVEEFWKFKKYALERGYYTNTALEKQRNFSEWLESQESIKNSKGIENKFIKITIPLKLTGGISIRKYSTKPEQADYEQITCNGVPVIPGNSWNGAIRADIVRILKELGCGQNKIEMLIAGWFGKIKKKKDKTDRSEQSLVVVGESILCSNVSILMTRNRINRFDASTSEGALYSEIAYYGGDTVLELMLKKDKQKAYKALIGILQIVIEDIQKGYTTVGGQAAIGRGIFEADRNRNIEYSEKVNLEECMAELYSIL